MKNSSLRLVVVPTDPISAYERANIDWLERYFNPTGMFQEVFALSPLEEGERKAHGMTIIGVPEHQFAQKVKEIAPDVVRAYGGFWPSDLVCRNRVRGIPVVVSVHDTFKGYVHDSVAYADLVIGVSQAVVTEVLGVGTDPKRIRLLPNRIDPEIFHPVMDPTAFQSIASRFPAGRHILHVGRRVQQKNLETLIRALEFLPAEYTSIFIGHGDKAKYHAIAEERGVADRCFWLDPVRNSELPLWYSWADCMCTPSRWEGFGIVFIEAAACGAAIVTSDIAPMNEYLHHDESACLVKDYENPSALAAAILKSCEDRDYRAKIKAGAIEIAKQFDLSAVDELEAAIYREAISMTSLSFQRRLDITAWNLRGTVSRRMNALRSHLKSVLPSGA